MCSRRAWPSLQRGRVPRGLTCTLLPRCGHGRRLCKKAPASLMCSCHAWPSLQRGRGSWQRDLSRCPWDSQQPASPAREAAAPTCPCGLTCAVLGHLCDAGVDLSGAILRAAHKKLAEVGRHGADVHVAATAAASWACDANDGVPSRTGTTRHCGWSHRGTTPFVDSTCISTTGPISAAFSRSAKLVATPCECCRASTPPTNSPRPPADG